MYVVRSAHGTAAHALPHDPLPALDTHPQVVAVAAAVGERLEVFLLGGEDTDTLGGEDGLVVALHVVVVLEGVGLPQLAVGGGHRAVPARKVRDVYWKVYNTLYIGGQDALVAGYPRIPNDAKNSYARYELDYVL